MFEINKEGAVLKVGEVEFIDQVFFAKLFACFIITLFRALLADLKARGLLDDTLVIWGGEFGRTPYSQIDNGKKSKSKPGRDHHHTGFSMFLAGGGVQGGLTHGATDELGMHAVDDRVHVHDLHATILHLLGLDHQRLTYRYSGRDFRLTDVYGQVVHQIIA